MEKKRRQGLPEVIKIQASSFDDALKRTSRDRFVSVYGHDQLPAVRMTPFLTTGLLAAQNEPISLQHTDDIW